METKIKLTESIPFRVFSIMFVVLLGLASYSLPSDVTNGTAIEAQGVLPQNSVTLPIKWDDLGKRMIDEGVIDPVKVEQIYTQRGGLDDYARELLYGKNNSYIKITRENSGIILNLLWGFGLANKNSILETGPMNDPRFEGGVGGFASTGGWMVAKDSAMSHYSMHAFVMLTPEQQRLVEETSKNIYRPCCDNPTYFPDCNHGMAMLGALELMAAQGLSEKEMYETALILNSFWFEDTYTTISKYFQKRGVSWSEINPKDVLGPAFSSASGFAKVRSDVNPQKAPQGAGCGL
ncbi:MAG: hypothetical protein COU46_02680 [Candidatus Niyogibacteria bacterium CG10_big_fil_rev_8_21_14_0_10_42_19]|uniref:Uncharacterized protein n=1 Tax=Candidatus Niyogibacteria bacterium CG10_big_fil_rev_8_21_14_0_10_42_19 TaxID=1974725 RepID=A0A2H0TFA1_9BACT|nr:MAG: hypothetical protein COU46_02680 [Candidatus Niyogibacteria bacterium CG10_big_fil_rev_8_21_14_0_10_42_19]